MRVVAVAAVAMAKRLYRANPKNGERRSLREISAELAKAGLVMATQYRNKGKGNGHVDRKVGEARPFKHATIKAMIEGVFAGKSRSASDGLKRPTCFKDHRS